MIKKVLVVCIGNICRSPMGAGLLKDRMPNLTVESAGLGALIGHPADSIAIDLMSTRGIDISGHIARPIDGAMCQRFDLILVMDVDQRRFIEDRYPSARGKVFRIADAVNRNVPDPYRRGPAAFNDAFEIIEAGVNAWTMKLNKLLNIERQPI